MSTNQTTSHAHHHITPLKTYLMIGAILLVMTVVTVAVASVDFGPANILIAMLIAGFKATLVAFFFMHLWYDNKLYFLIFASSLAFLAIFIGLTMFDTQRRAEIDRIKGHPIEPKAIIYLNPQAPPAHGGAAMHDSTKADTTKADTAKAVVADSTVKSGH